MSFRLLLLKNCGVDTKMSLKAEVIRRFKGALPGNKAC